MAFDAVLIFLKIIDDRKSEFYTREVREQKLLKYKLRLYLAISEIKRWDVIVSLNSCVRCTIL